MALSQKSDDIASNNDTSGIFNAKGFTRQDNFEKDVFLDASFINTLKISCLTALAG